MSDDFFYPDFDLGAFRYAVARYIKLLIRARWKCQPEFLSSDDLARWELDNIQNDTYPAWRLMDDAAAALARLNTEFIPRCGSGGVPVTDGATPEVRLMDAVAFLARSDGGGPYHNMALVEAANDLQKGRVVDWDSLVNWSTLPEIRADLDKLPHPSRPPALPYQPRNHASPKEEQPSWNLFCKDGDDWRIRFSGGKPFQLRDAPGLFYIHYLLVRPDRACTVFEMFMAWSTHQAPQSRRAGGEIDAGTARELGLNSNRSPDDGLVLDEEGIARCREEFLWINDQLQRAKTDNDEAKVNEMTEERRRLVEAVAAASKPGGGPKKVGDQLKRWLDRVCKAITRSVEKIGPKDQRLQQHLLNSLHTGYICRYAPETCIIWNQ